MRGHKTSKRITYMIIAFLFIIMCVVNQSYAASTPPTPSSSSATLPKIEMKVKSFKVGTSNQIKVECWGSNFTNLEGVEILFTYDSTKLTPSNISDNTKLPDLDSIKYKEAPKGDTLLEQLFNEESRTKLLPSFQFDSNYERLLDVDIFKYLAPNGDNEALQFIMSKKDDAANITATDAILLGTFSFIQADGTTIEENEFSTQRIKVFCEDGLGREENGASYYTREQAKSENCTDIINFIYEKYGSISGEIELGYMWKGTFTKLTKQINEVTISVYESSKVADIDFTKTGSSYRTSRNRLKPLLGGVYSKLIRTDKSGIPETGKEPDFEITTSSINVNSSGNIDFKIDKIPYGNYVVFIDREDYGDYIIRNVEIDAARGDIDLGKKQLLAGDLDKTGKVDANDKTLCNRLLKDDGRKSIGYNFFDLDGDGKGGANDQTLLKRVLDNGNTTVKVVEDL